MQINRRLLYAGVFLLALGVVLVLADLGAVDTAAITNALRLWPLAVIALGLGVVLRRTQFSLQAGLVGAALPGLVLRGAFAVGPRVATECGHGSNAPAQTATRHGTFEGPASVTLGGGCGALTVKTAPGNTWQLITGNSAGHEPNVRSSPFSLAVDAGENEGWPFRDTGRNSLDVTLPADNMQNLTMIVYAGQGSVSLAGARMDRLSLTANAANVVVDASGATSVRNVLGTVRVGTMSIALPDGDVSGTFRVGGGELRVCAPPGLGLRVTSSGFPKEITVDGVHRNGSGWESENYASAAHHADIRVNVNIGSVEINPTGGCR